MPEFHGKEETKLEDAFKSAWQVATKEGNKHKTLQVEKILVHGTNPITGYSVVLKPGP